jgi:hypothetical protein
MDSIDLVHGLTLADLTTLAGLAIVTAIFVELVKRTLALSEEATSRFGPVLAVVIGIVVGVVAAVVTGAFIPQAVLTGFLAGALAAGLYDVVADRIATIFAKLTGASPG